MTNGVVLSEISMPFEELELSNLTKHYKKELMPVTIKKKCERRGRKRLNVLPAANFEDLLNKVVIPKWTEILKKKTKREGALLGHTTDEHLWVKVLRDMRDFYRIIFKSRFHRSEKREDSNRDVLVKIFLEELGFSGINLIDTISVYDFLYKAHYKARSTNNGSKFKEAINRSSMKIYYYYNEAARNKFLKDDLCARLLYYFLYNFGNLYLSCLQKNLKQRLQSMIKSILKSYSNHSI